MTTPSGTITRYKAYPAAVVHPAFPRPLQRVFIVLAEGGEHAGLHVYSKPDHLAWHAPVNWLRTTLPARERRWRRGVDIHLADGTVAVITVGGACRCGALGKWAGPQWANTVQAGGAA